MTSSPEPFALPDDGRGGALGGVLVLEITETPAGEVAGGLLADLGATVVKIEPPDGSPMRRRGPALPGEDALAFQSENRGKYSVRADLGGLSSEPWLGRLLATADALIEDLGPGRLESAGLSPEQLERGNPRLVTLRISPFGQTGPLAGERGDDRIAQAFSGVQFVTGFPDRAPLPVTVPLAESWSAILGSGGLLTALFHARRSGRGQVVDIGLYQTALRMQEEVVVRYDRTGSVAGRLGTESPIVVPANVYPTRDGGWIAVSGAGDQPFARLCEAIEAPDAPKDPRFATPAARLQHRAASDALVGDWIAAHDQAHVEARFADLGVAGTAVNSADDVLADAHVKAREAVLALTSTSGQELLVPAAVPKLTRTPAAPPRRAPKLGEHTEMVRAAIERLEARPPVDAPGRGDAAVRPAGSADAWGPLRGIRVLDLSQWLAGPAAAALLADFGADVIMVELPSVAADAQGRKSPGFVVTNRNKRSITLDVRSPAGREAFLGLVALSDVIVENFRPGTLERWDLAPATLLAANPRLVLLRSSGFGQSGPYTQRAAFNPVGLAFGGLTYLNGWPDRPPLRDGVMAGDYSTALFNVLGVMAALLRRDVDGQGQVVDTAMFEAALRLTGDLLAVRSALGIRRERAGGDSHLYPATVTAEAADGRFVVVSAASWEDVAGALARIGRRGASEGEARKPIGDADLAGLREEVASLMRGLPAAEAVSALRGAGLAASAVNSVADLVREPHCWSRGDLLRLAHPEMGEIVTQGIVPSLSRTPGRVAGWSSRPGSDNQAVLGGLLGYSTERIRELG
jgi:succinyl-CoA---D-citramalate CoA-transferase